MMQTTSGAAQLAITRQPAKGSVGLSLAGIEVEIHDSNGQLVPIDGLIVELVSDAEGLTGARKARTRGGVAKFSRANFTGTGTFILTALAPGVGVARSEPIEIGDEPDWYVTRLVEDHLEYCRALVKEEMTRFPRQVTFDDVFAEALGALWGAASRYNGANDKRATFRTYAYRRIKGAITDYRRQFAIEHSSLRNRFEDAANEVMSEIDGQLPVRFNSAEEVSEATRAAASAVMGAYIVSTAAKHDEVPDPAPGPFAGIAAAEIMRKAADHDPRLPAVLKLYFWDGCSMEEIAEQIGVDKSTVSRLMTKGLAWLRNEFGSTAGQQAGRDPR